MDTEITSPKITNLSWGQCEVESGESYKDAKLWPGGSRTWDWNETGTSHSGGIQPEDVQELMEHGAKTIVLSRGQVGRLKVPQETLDWIEEQGIVTHVLKTKQAVEKYNELAGSDPVGALIHSTC